MKYTEQGRYTVTFNHVTNVLLKCKVDQFDVPLMGQQDQAGS